MYLVWSVGVCVWAPLCLSEHSVTLKQSWFSFTPFLSSSRVDCFYLFCPLYILLLGKMIFPTFLFLICPSICCRLTLLPTFLIIAPPSPTHPPTHLPTRVPFSLSLSLYSAGGPARRQCMRSRSVICSFSPSHFHFNPLFTAGTKALCMQMSKSWLFFFSRAYIQKRDGQEKGRSWMRRLRERGATKAEE